MPRAKGVQGILDQKVGNCSGFYVTVLPCCTQISNSCLIHFVDNRSFGPTAVSDDV